MSHNCFISYKKEDKDLGYLEAIIDRLGSKRVLGKALDKWIDSQDIDYVMQKIRDEYMSGTTVTLYLIGSHSSENEGLDTRGRNKQAFVIRELQATLYDRKGNPRDGLLGIVLPEMEQRVFGQLSTCSNCGETVQSITITDDTVIREFKENYWLAQNECGHYDETGRFAVLCRYSEFMKDPETYIDLAFEKTKQPIANKVHYHDIEHRGM